MLQAGYTAVQGIKAQQKRLDIISNNLANVNTNGFKSVHVEFKDMLYENLKSPVEQEEDVNLRRGHGVLVSGANRNFTGGSVQVTNVETDIMIQGDGFFAVGMQDGTVLYTRDGSFSKSVEETGVYLVNSNGNYVLSAEGAPIQIQGNSFAVSDEGYISAGDGSEPYAQIQVVRFVNQQGLEAVTDNLYRATESSGEALLANGSTQVKQGALEASNVNLAEEMQTLIRTQRAFSFASRALSQADEMDGTANALRS